jgi:hypothetical protein
MLALAGVAFGDASEANAGAPPAAVVHPRPDPPQEERSQ